MITFEKGTITEEQLRDITKNILGIRYCTKKNGDFQAYANAGTMFVDIIKKIKSKLL